MCVVVNKTRDELTNVAAQLSTLSSQGSQLAENLTIIGKEVQAQCDQSASAGRAVCGNFKASDYAVSANFSTVSGHLFFFSSSFFFLS